MKFKTQNKPTTKIEIDPQKQETSDCQKAGTRVHEGRQKAQASSHGMKKSQGGKSQKSQHKE